MIELTQNRSVMTDNTKTLTNGENDPDRELTKLEEKIERDVETSLNALAEYPDDFSEKEHIIY